MKPILFIIDAYNLIYRMFYAIPEMHTREGMQVNAIFGVAKFLKWLAEENPNAFLVVATDLGSSFREGFFSEYKGTRDRMPDNLRSQIDGVFELFSSANIQIIGKEWYEADDVMGSIAVQNTRGEYQVVIISSDKDLCQFVRDDFVHIYDAMKRKFMREKDVLEKFWVPTHQVCDYLAIVGDTADNIPWIAGFWPKKTADLLNKYHSLEKIYENLEDFTPKMRESLKKSKDEAFLSQKLATIITDLEIWPIQKEKFSEKILQDSYLEVLKKYEFKSLLPKEFLDEVPKLEIPSEEIQALDEYEKYLEKWKSFDSFLGISLDSQRKIYISYNAKVYILDSKKIDVYDLIDAILDWKIKVTSYDIKALFLQLWNMKHPIQIQSQQESLF